MVWYLMPKAEKYTPQDVLYGTNRILVSWLRGTVGGKPNSYEYGRLGETVKCFFGV